MTRPALAFAVLSLCAVFARAQAPLLDPGLGLQIKDQMKAAREAADLDVIRKAGLDPEALRAEGWTEQELGPLARAITAASDATFRQQEAHTSNVSATFYGNGTMVNLEQSLIAVTQDDKDRYQRGCAAHQNAVRAALAREQLPGLEARRIMLGAVLEHHAVVVFPKGTDWEKTGIVFDGWYHQESAPNRMTFTIDSWKSKFPAHRVISSTHLED